MHVYNLKRMPKTVFRAYDIRGIIGKELDEDAFYTVGKAVASELIALDKTGICIGRDARLTSASLAKALTQGLIDSGIDVFDLGEIPSPIMYYATKTSGVDSGLMVTGSHNPAEYNGIKMVIAGKTLVESDITRLYERVQSQNFQQRTSPGMVVDFPITEKYAARIKSDISLKRKLKVVVDCGNGVAGPIIPPVLEALGCEVIPLYCEVDGRFPNHHPDPTVEANLQDLIAAVKEHGADAGFGFDGDADRLGVVTNLGEIIWPDRLMMLYAKHILADTPNATIVYDVKCSSHLADVITKSNGKARMSPTGHSIVKGIMQQEDAVLAGEMSGHIFFKHRWYGFDDALYSACRLLEIMSFTDETLSEIFQAIPNSVNTPEIKIPIVEEEKFDFMARFAEMAKFDDAECIRIDGLRVEFPHGWGLIRASNTTPCLVARFEAESSEALDKIQARFKHALQSVDDKLPVPF